ncbi:MAG TPA: lysophospholipid acyltransferase family protein [bacterium]|nr:lysophospholipid acyltransferase family protein [bacterium]
MRLESARIALRSAFWWTLSAIHFFPGSIALSLLSYVLPLRRVDPFLRAFVRNVVRLSGARLEVRHASGFDPFRTSFFLSNHVSVFDPFFVHSSLPQLTRGMELESHFRVFGYGWMMRRMGNVPVPDTRNTAGLRRMMKETKKSLKAGVSLIAFPEGHRTRSGALGPFEAGVFRLARELGVPIVPVTTAGAYEHHRVGDWNLYPGPVVVHVHDTIPVERIKEMDTAALMEHVRRVMEGAQRG